MFLFQKEKRGIVMVNFYNDYVTCKQTATISDVAGESFWKQLQCLLPCIAFLHWALYDIRQDINMWLHFSIWHTDHFDHIKKVAGSSIIGFGGDYDGVPR